MLTAATEVIECNTVARFGDTTQMPRDWMISDGLT